MLHYVADLLSALKGTRLVIHFVTVDLYSSDEVIIEASGGGAMVKWLNVKHLGLRGCV
jgi:hypothetical protein